MLEIDQTWTSTGSSGVPSGGPASVFLAAGAIESVLQVTHSTLATTQSVSLQTAPESTGPWISESSASIATAVAGGQALRVTGPYKYARPYLHTESTGSYTLRLTAVG